MQISHIQFRQINNEYCVTVNKFRFKLVSSKVASAIFELTKMRALQLINAETFTKSVNDILQLD